MKRKLLLIGSLGLVFSTMLVLFVFFCKGLYPLSVMVGGHPLSATVMGLYGILAGLGVLALLIASIGIFHRLAESLTEQGVIEAKERLSVENFKPVKVNGGNLINHGSVSVLMIDISCEADVLVTKELSDALVSAAKSETRKLRVDHEQVMSGTLATVRKLELRIEETKAVSDEYTSTVKLIVKDVQENLRQKTEELEVANKLSAAIEQGMFKRDAEIKELKQELLQHKPLKSFRIEYLIGSEQRQKVIQCHYFIDRNGCDTEFRIHRSGGDHVMATLKSASIVSIVEQ